MTDIARRMAQVRGELGMTQKDMADRLGVPYRTLQDGERGVAQPGAATLAAYGEHGIDLNWLVMGHKLEPIQDSSAQENPRHAKKDHFTEAVALMIGAGVGTRFRVDALADGLRIALESDLIEAGDRARLSRLVQALDRGDL